MAIFIYKKKQSSNNSTIMKHLYYLSYGLLVVNLPYVIFVVIFEVPPACTTAVRCCRTIDSTTAGQFAAVFNKMSRSPCVTIQRSFVYGSVLPAKLL